MYVHILYIIYYIIYRERERKRKRLQKHVRTPNNKHNYEHKHVCSEPRTLFIASPASNKPRPGQSPGHPSQVDPGLPPTAPLLTNA